MECRFFALLCVYRWSTPGSSAHHSAPQLGSRTSKGSGREPAPAARRRPDQSPADATTITPAPSRAIIRSPLLDGNQLIRPGQVGHLDPQEQAKQADRSHEQRHQHQQHPFHRRGRRAGLPKRRSRTALECSQASCPGQLAESTPSRWAGTTPATGFCPPRETEMAISFIAATVRIPRCKAKGGGTRDGLEYVSGSAASAPPPTSRAIPPTGSSRVPGPI